MSATTSSSLYTAENSGLSVSGQSFASRNKKPPLLRVDAIFEDEMDLCTSLSNSTNHLNVIQTSFDNEKAMPPKKLKAQDSIKLARKQFSKEQKNENENFSKSDDMINESVMQNMLVDSSKGKLDNLSKSPQTASRVLSNSVQDIKNIDNEKKNDDAQSKEKVRENNSIENFENADETDSSETDPLFCCACNKSSNAAESTALNSSLASQIGGFQDRRFNRENPFRWLYRRIRALFGVEFQSEVEQPGPVWLRNFSWNFGSDLESGQLLQLMPREPTYIGSTDFARVRNQMSCQVFAANVDN